MSSIGHASSAKICMELSAFTVTDPLLTIIQQPKQPHLVHIQTANNSTLYTCQHRTQM